MLKSATNLYDLVQRCHCSHDVTVFIGKGVKLIMLRWKQNIAETLRCVPETANNHFSKYQLTST